MVFCATRHHVEYVIFAMRQVTQAGLQNDDILMVENATPRATSRGCLSCSRRRVMCVTSAASLPTPSTGHWIRRREMPTSLASAPASAVCWGSPTSRPVVSTFPCWTTSSTSTSPTKPSCLCIGASQSHCDSSRFCVRFCCAVFMVPACHRLFVVWL